MIPRETRAEMYEFSHRRRRLENARTARREIMIELIFDHSRARINTRCRVVAVYTHTSPSAFSKDNRLAHVAKSFTLNRISFPFMEQVHYIRGDIAASKEEENEGRSSCLFSKNASNLIFE